MEPARPSIANGRRKNGLELKTPAKTYPLRLTAEAGDGRRNGWAAA